MMEWMELDGVMREYMVVLLLHFIVCAVVNTEHKQGLQGLTYCLTITPCICLCAPPSLPSFSTLHISSLRKAPR
jgi:hypothetical protein